MLLSAWRKEDWPPEMKPARLGPPPWHLGPLNPLSHHLWGQFFYAVRIQSLKILGFVDEGQAHPENGILGSGLAPPMIVDVSLQNCGERLLLTSHPVCGVLLWQPEQTGTHGTR